MAKNNTTRSAVRYGIIPSRTAATPKPAATQPSRSADSSAYWQRATEQAKAAKPTQTVSAPADSSAYWQRATEQATVTKPSQPVSVPAPAAPSQPTSPAQPSRSADSSAYWQKVTEQAMVSKPAQPVSVPAPAVMPQPTSPAQPSRSADSSAYWQKVIEQAKAAKTNQTGSTAPGTVRYSLSTAVPGAAPQKDKSTDFSKTISSTASKFQAVKDTSKIKTKSDISPRSTGSYYNMKISNSKKRELLGEELIRILETEPGKMSLKQRDRLAMQQGNIVQQLNMLDAAEGKAPRRYVEEAIRAMRNADTTKTVALPGDGSYINAAKRVTDAANGIPNIQALGANRTLTGAQEKAITAEWLREIRDSYMSNLAIERAGLGESKDNTEHLNGQTNGALATMSFGKTIDEKESGTVTRALLHKFNKAVGSPDFGTVANAGCESIAVYNTLHDLGKDVSLSKIISDTERNNYMLWNGWFGTKTYKVDDLLRQYGVESKPVYSSAVQSAADNGEITDGQIYIASILNNKDAPLRGFEGIHTFEIVYSPDAYVDTPWVVYNRNSKTEEKKYASLEDVLEENEKYGKYISMLEINQEMG